jgi:uncharacterized iron-regulated protein
MAGTKTLHLWRVKGFQSGSKVLKVQKIHPWLELARRLMAGARRGRLWRGRSLALVAALLLSGCAGGSGFEADSGPWASEIERTHPLAGRIWAPDQAAFVSEAALIQDLAAADFVLLGEKHDNEDHHRVQAWVTKALLGRGRPRVIAFEMFTVDQADAIAAYAAQHPTDAAGLGAAVKWEQRGWPDWRMYQPIAQAALDAGAPIQAADLPRTTLRAITKEGTGALGAQAERRLGLEQPIPAGMRSAMEDEIVDAHCNALPASMIGPMTTVMYVRDAHMAGAMIEGAAVAGRDGSILITGTGHARRDYGVPFHLKRLAPGKRSLSLAMVEVAEGETDPAAYAARYNAPALPFDYVWFTPRPSREPACERFADQLRRAKERHQREQAPK